MIIQTESENMPILLLLLSYVMMIKKMKIKSNKFEIIDQNRISENYENNRLKLWKITQIGQKVFLMWNKNFDRFQQTLKTFETF